VRQTPAPMASSIFKARSAIVKDPFTACDVNVRSLNRDTQAHEDQHGSYIAHERSHSTRLFDTVCSFSFNLFLQSTPSHTIPLLRSVSPPPLDIIALQKQLHRKKATRKFLIRSTMMHHRMAWSAEPCNGADHRLRVPFLLERFGVCRARYEVMVSEGHFPLADLALCRSRRRPHRWGCASVLRVFVQRLPQKLACRVPVGAQTV